MPGRMKPCLTEVLTPVHTVTSVVWLMVELLLMCCRLVMLPMPIQHTLPAGNRRSKAQVRHSFKRSKKCNSLHYGFYVYVCVNVSAIVFYFTTSVWHIFTKYNVFVVDDPAFIPKHLLLLVLEPLPGEDKHQHIKTFPAFVCCRECVLHRLTTMVRMKPLLKRATGSPMATLIAMDIGQMPQSAGQFRQFSSTSQTSSPHTWMIIDFAV